MSDEAKAWLLDDNRQIQDLNHPNEDDVGCGDGQTPCACNPDQESDGIDDLKLQFATDDMAAAGLLDGAQDEIIVLELSGNLLDGTAFVAKDCVRLVGPGESPGELAVSSNVPGGGVFIDVLPLDDTLDTGGFTDFVRTYAPGTQVTLTAPAWHAERS